MAVQLEPTQQNLNVYQQEKFYDAEYKWLIEAHFTYIHPGRPFKCYWTAGWSKHRWHVLQDQEQKTIIQDKEQTGAEQLGQTGVQQQGHTFMDDFRAMSPTPVESSNTLPLPAPPNPAAVTSASSFPAEASSSRSTSNEATLVPVTEEIKRGSQGKKRKHGGHCVRAMYKLGYALQRSARDLVPIKKIVLP